MTLLSIPLGARPVTVGQDIVTVGADPVIITAAQYASDGAVADGLSSAPELSASASGLTAGAAAAPTLVGASGLPVMSGVS